MSEARGVPVVYIDSYFGDSALVAGLRQANERLRSIIEEHGIILCPSCDHESDNEDEDTPCLSCRIEAAEHAMEGDR